MNNTQNSLTEGSVSKGLIRFGLPFLLSNFVQSLYGVADLYIVSHFNGAESIAGVNIGSQITMLFTSFVTGLVTGGTVLLAQYIGAKREKDASETIGTMFSLMLILALLMTAIMIICSDFFLHLVNAPPEAFSEAKSYLVICMYGTVFVFGYNVVTAILRSMGDSTRPFFFVCIAAAVNVALDYYMVGILGWKASGAALATIISQGISLLTALIYLIRKEDFIFQFKLANFRISMDKLKRMLQIGIPTSIMSTISSLSFFTLSALINVFGVNATAGAGIAGKINSFAIMPSGAMQAAVTTMSGQNIGAGYYDRAKKTLYTGIQIAFVIGAIIFVLMQTVPESFIRIFTDDPETIAYGVNYVKAFSFDYLIVPMAFCCSGLITSSGNTLFVSLVSVLTSLVIRMPVAYILGHYLGLGLFGIGLAVPLTSVVSFLMCFAFIRSGRWMTSKVIGEAGDG